MMRSVASISCVRISSSPTRYASNSTYPCSYFQVVLFRAGVPPGPDIQPLLDGSPPREHQPRLLFRAYYRRLVC